MRITAARIDRAHHIATSTGAAARLDAAMRTDRRGRPPVCGAELFLTGAILNIQRKGNMVIEDIHRTLTLHISLDHQRKLGVRWDHNGSERVLGLDHLYSFVRRFRDSIGHPAVVDPDNPTLDPDERARRVTALDDTVQDLMDATTGHGLPSSTHAADGTAIWAWGKGRPGDAPSLNDDAGHDGRDTSESDEDAAGTTWDPDAAWSHKTGKFGKPQPYYGYELHALARVPDEDQTANDLPVLVEGVDLTPANFDLVEPTLRIIDRLAEGGKPITDFLGDRHYSYKKTERWADQLTERGIDQHLDLRVDDHGFAPYNGMKMAAAWPHCPATPDRLGDIPKPPPTGSKAEFDEFYELIAERQQYAFAPHGKTAAGNPRYICPARDGTVGCPLVDGTVDVANEHGLPVVTNAPDPADAPKCCTQKTVTLGPDAERKLRQPHYWGSKAWQDSYNRRTHIEGFFGNLKNQSTEAVGRGFHRVAGIAPIKLFIGIAVATCNLRQLRNWHDRTGNGDPDHPLLTPDEDHGFIDATPELLAKLQQLDTGSDDDIVA